MYASVSIYISYWKRLQEVIAPGKETVQYISPCKIRNLLFLHFLYWFNKQDLTCFLLLAVSIYHTDMREVPIFSSDSLQENE